MDAKTQLVEIFSKQLNWPTDKKSLRDHYSVIWHNTRKKNAGGMRLTDRGFELFTQILDIKSYNIEFPKDFTFTNQIIIWLDRFIDGPYYITNHSIIVFKEKTAVQLILFSGDIQKFGLAKAMSLKTNSNETTA